VDLFSNGEITLDQQCVFRLKEFINRRLKHEPLQYILGTVDFRYINLKTDPRALIPRPETEGLVQIGLDHLAGTVNPSVLDIGTGCGAVALSIINEHPTAHIRALDKSREALALAEENARKLESTNRIRFIRTDLFEDDWLKHFESPFDLIISNPPYVSQKEFWELPPEIRLWEPPSALLSGEDGLQFIHRIARTAGKVLKANGYLICEIGERQARKTLDIFQHTGWDAFVRKDLNGRPRYVIASRVEVGGDLI
jgi:release factor glutamine methyltransferase